MSVSIIIALNQCKICYVTRIGKQGAIAWRGIWESDGGNVYSGSVEESFRNTCNTGISNGNWGLDLSFCNLIILQGMKR